MIDQTITIGKEETNALIEASVKVRSLNKPFVIIMTILRVLLICISALLIFTGIYTICFAANFSFKDGVFPILFGTFVILLATALSHPVAKLLTSITMKGFGKKNLEGDRRFQIDNNGIVITSFTGTSQYNWEAFTYYRHQSHFLWILTVDQKLVLLDYDRLTDGEMAELQSYLDGHGIKRMG